MTTSAAIALGGNLGNVSETFSRAIDLINRTSGLRVAKRSSNYITRAIGAAAGGDYLNAAVILNVDCPSLELLLRLQEIETRLGRVRTVHWGPRTLDLDILSYGSQTVQIPPLTGQGSGEGEQKTASPVILTIPHPACWYRRFALDPWAEIDPEWKHPLFQETVHQRQARLLNRPLRVLIVADEVAKQRLAGSLRSLFSENELTLNYPVEDQPILAETERTANFEVVFQIDPQPPLPTSVPRSVRLPPETAVETATQILRAMLDEPHRLT